MRVLLVGNNKKTLENQQKILQENFSTAEMIVFLDPLLAIKYSMRHTVNLVISEFALRMIDGIQFIILLQTKNPDIISILIEKRTTHREEAKKLGIGYLTHPLTSYNFLALYEKMSKEDGEKCI